jgi:hypothetical protein
MTGLSRLHHAGTNLGSRKLCLGRRCLLCHLLPGGASPQWPPAAHAEGRRIHLCRCWRYLIHGGLSLRQLRVCGNGVGLTRGTFVHCTSTPKLEDLPFRLASPIDVNFASTCAEVFNSRSIINSIINNRDTMVLVGMRINRSFTAAYVHSLDSSFPPQGQNLHHQCARNAHGLLWMRPSK